MLELRFNDESDGEFRDRAKRALRIARVLVEACLANACIQEYVAADDLPFYTTEAMRKSPIVRVEFEQAIAIGDMGSCLAATKSKHWGDGPWIAPLEPDDEFYPTRITYIYRDDSLYNRRFQQRKRMKELLGKRWRRLVTEAKQRTKKLFLEHLSKEEAAAIRRCLNVGPGEFWRAASGSRFLSLPPRMVQQALQFDD